MRYLLTILICVTPVFAIGQENLAAKVVRLPLSQEQPSIIRLGIHGITTIEFPTKIEALDGYGFSLNPGPDGQDLFQISFNTRLLSRNFQKKIRIFSEICKISHSFHMPMPTYIFDQYGHFYGKN